VKVAWNLGDVEHDPNTVVTVGSFDGLHLAHREIIKEVVNRARMREGRSVVITFDPHPSEVVGKGKPPAPLLTTNDERMELLRQLNIDLLLILGFTKEFSLLSPVEFYRQYIVEGTGVSEVIVGYDHMFGRERGAGVQELVAMGGTFGFSVFSTHPVAVKGITVSSTGIRDALLKGDIALANMLLGYNYTVRGNVVPGDGRGKTLGYPTANIRVSSPRKLIPARGVYLVGVQVAGEQYYGMMNVGVRPTVTSQPSGVTLEVHILDLSRDIYGEQVAVSFLNRLRDERNFGTLSDLVAQLDRDKEESIRYLEQWKKAHHIH
jgi:riboflavin kinase/FMN adenylyltransferase